MSSAGSGGTDAGGAGSGGMDAGGAGSGGIDAGAGSGGCGHAGAEACEVHACDAITSRTLPATSGYVACRGGWLHRPHVADCTSRLPRTNSGNGGAGGGRYDGLGGGSNCESDEDCAESAYGFCERSEGDFIRQICVYGCTTDDDCESGEICVCGDPVGRCEAASCVSDADCATGSLCAGTPYVEPCIGNVSYVFACQRNGDACMTDADCPSDEYMMSSCDVSETGRSCSLGSACGRPFLVRGAARVATSQTANRGWSARFDSAASELDLESRRELADHWTRLGLMEHASVAAFARFALDLLSLGAPAELMLETQRALGDEIAHATLCFGLASRYAGHEIGPGVLPLEGALDARSSWEIIETLIVEACVGETLAAAEAEAALFGTRDPQVRDVLERIVSDEARHAELGWRALCWMLRDADAALVARAE